jgi:hypothetical protein
MVPRAQLRVFSPLDDFPPRERERWAAYVDAGNGLTRREVAATEERSTTVRLVTGRTPMSSDAALVRRAGRRILICPLELDLRAAHALATFRRHVPEQVLDAFVPDGRGKDRLERLSDSGRVPHILDEAWVVPLHWFVAFGPDERHLTDPPEGNGPRVTHLTTCGQALARLERAIDAVETGVEDGEDVLAALAGTAAWLDSFDAASLLELDYGGVAAMLDEQQLRDDTTCEELWEAIEALLAGDLLAAAAAYGVARARWSRWHAKQHAS